MSEKRKVFVSYSRADKDKVLPLVKNLEKNVCTKFWIDESGIESTAQFLNVIRQAIKDCQIVLFMLSDNSINGEWTQREIMFAKECGKRVVPVILDGRGLRDWAELYFVNVNYVDAKDNFQLEKLSKEIVGWIEIGTTSESTSIKSKTSSKSLAAIRNKLLRLVAALKIILLVVAALIVIFFIIGILLPDKPEIEEIPDVEVNSVQSEEFQEEDIPKIEVESKTKVVTDKKVKSEVETKAEVITESGTSAEAVVQKNVINGHEYIDLGLSCKWATCNVGAGSAEIYGNYYAWGEISPKSTYTADNSVSYKKIWKDISGDPTRDAARANWGGSWRMPTGAEYQELLDNCTFTWTTLEGKKGYMVTSNKNGESIFFPVSSRDGDWGGYWLSIPCTDDSEKAKCFGIDAKGHGFGICSRYVGLSIRPVFD